MFCPNCGKDCGDARFCSDCGTQLPQNTPKSANTAKGSTNIPTSGGYLGLGGSIVLSDSAVSICVNSLFKKYRTWIPYDQLTTVIYLRPTLTPKKDGALLFRGKPNKDIPIPETKRLYADKASVIVPPERDTLFYHLYYMLKAVAPSETTFEMIVAPVNLRGSDELTQTVDMDYFFHMYAPYRERAASGIHAKYEIPQEVARALVDRVFDTRQRVMYDAEPLAAIQDLNLIVDDMRKQEQRINRADAERRKRQDQEAIKSSLERLERMKRIEMLEDYLEDQDQ